MTTTTDMQPVPVHVTNAGILATRKRKRHHTIYRTFVLTAANPVIPVLAEDMSRTGAHFQAIGNSVLICESQSQAQDPDNAVALAFANPQGLLLYVDAAATGLGSGGLSVSDRWPIFTNDVVWATAIAFPAFLAVSITSEVSGY